MNKLQIIISVGLITFASALQAQDYVRKEVRPNYFVPNTEFNRREKLPAFPSLENGTIKVTDKGVMVKVQDSPKDKKTENSKFSVRKLRPKPMKTEREEVIAVIRPTEAQEKSAKNTYDEKDGLENNLSRNPEYVALEKAYERDLQSIARTGQMPKNPKLESDLQKMTTDTSFAVK